MHIYTYMHTNIGFYYHVLYLSFLAVGTYIICLTNCYRPGICIYDSGVALTSS